VICAATDHQQQQCHQAYAGMTNAVLFGNKKVAARARKAPRGWGVWRRCLLSPVGRGLGRGHFSFWSSKSIVLLHFECCFVSSSTTDGLLWDDLSGSIAQGNRVKPQDLNGRSCFFIVSPYKSTVLFLISSFNPPLLPRRPVPKCVPIFIRN